MIRHFKHSEIDFEKWDNCIENAVNSLIYAKSWYLNIVSPLWEALIMDNYEAVMPLPKKKKYCLPYFTQPVLTQQLGIFSKNNIDKSVVNQFIDKIPLLPYRLNLNEENYFGNLSKNMTVLPNYLLDLQQDYEKLYENFSQNTKRNIEKAEKQQVIVKQSINSKEFLDFYFSMEKNYTEPNRETTTKLLNECCKRNEIVFYAAYCSENKLIAALALLKSKRRLIYFLPASNEEGKNESAMFLIINEIIKQNQNTNTLLDFEGSKIDGIARFYQGFGAILKPYCHIKRFF